MSKHLKYRENVIVISCIRIMTVDAVSAMQRWEFWQVQTVLKELCSEMESVPEMWIL